MVGEWQPPEGSEVAGPPRDNPIVGHVVQRLLNMVYPPLVSEADFSIKKRDCNFNSQAVLC